MNDSHEIKLPGCAPEPLMSYLKALGILRLVSEQADPQAAGCWRNDRFVLWSCFDDGSLARFFLRDYRPTPIAGPWAGGSGFFTGDNRKAVDAIGSSKSARAEAYRLVIGKAREILRVEGVIDKPAEEVKARLLGRYRREMPDQFVRWMDAAMVLQSAGPSFAPLLGTGGNDGRLDFTQNFMQRIVELKLLESEPSPKSVSLLRLCLFGEPARGLGRAAVGQFAPGRAGGPNATQGMEGEATDNPWDFILMLEGALMLAGAAVRRLGSYGRSRAAFPFTVRSRSLHESGPSADDISSSRGELWLPLWDQPARMLELEAMFAEGRAELAGRPATDTVSFARAVASLGVDRGIRSFARYSFLRRSGKNYLAAAMDRFAVPEKRLEASDLLGELDPWLDAYRRVCEGKNSPPRFKASLRRIESSIFDYCRYGRREELRAVLIALGRAERELAVTAGKLGQEEVCSPCAGLSPQWLTIANDGSVEFEIGLSLAGIYDGHNRIGQLRCNLEPVVFDKGRWKWTDSQRQAVWNSAGLAANMASILHRRLMDGARAGCNDAPLDFRRGLRPDAVAAFAAGEVNDLRIEDLLWGLVLIDQREQYPDMPPPAHIEAPPLPRAYALLKPLFLPGPLVREWDEGRRRTRWRLARRDEPGIIIRPEPRVLPLLRAGRLREAFRIAYQRLRSSGLEPMPGPRRSGEAREAEWEPDPSIDTGRLAAALLLPVGSNTIDALLRLITRPFEEDAASIPAIIGAH